MDQKKPQKPKLRKIGRSAYIYFFPLLFTFIFVAFAAYWEQYYQTEFPVWAYLLLIPLGLLGIVIGVQLQMYLQKTIGRKGEALINILLLTVLAAAFFAEYRYVFVRQLGAPPLSLRLLLDALRRRLPSGGRMSAG